MKLVLHSVTKLTPVRVGGIRIVNQPWFFNVVWFFVQTIIKRKLKRRIAILGSRHDELLQVSYSHDHVVPRRLRSPHRQATCT